MAILVAQLLLFIVISLAGIAMMRRAKGKIPFIRKLAALDALEMAVGRATEMGKAVVFCPGNSKDDPGTGLTGFEASQNLAGLAVLEYVARLTARYNVPILIAMKNPELIPLVDTIVGFAYRAEGKADAYSSENIRFLGTEQMSFMVGYIGLLLREKPAANIMIGAMYGESISVITAGNEAGAVQIGGTARPQAATYFVACCDYSLLGEEIFAAGAYVSKDPKQLGTIAGQDISKFIVVALIVIGAILATGGLPKLIASILQSTV